MRIVALWLSICLTAWSASQAVIIFDASGSMWGQIEGKAKITVAKKVLTRIIEGWNRETKLALIAYGHRRKGDCNDIEMLLPLDNVDTHAALKAVASITPKGKTPISRALRKAAEALRTTEEKATVILISDGRETCDPDPCATAKTLKDEGIDFVAHVIGFHVDKTTDRELGCIAEVTGGSYFSVDNAEELTRAMRTVAKEAARPEPLPNITLSASEYEGDAWIQAHHEIFRYRKKHFVNETPPKEDYVTSCTSFRDKACNVHLDKGRYMIVSTYNAFTRRTLLEVTDDKPQKRHILMGRTGKIRIDSIDGDKRVQANYTFYKNENGERGDYVTGCTTYSGDTCEATMPAGDYIVKIAYEYDGTYITYTSYRPMRIEPGKIKRYTHRFHKIAVRPVHIIPCLKIDYTILDKEGKPVIEKSAYADETTVAVLDEGNYTLKAQSGDQTVTLPVVIKEGNLRITPDFNGSHRFDPLKAVWYIDGIDSRVTLRHTESRVTGTYPTDNGKIVGKMVTSHRFEGFWIEDDSRKKCNVMKEGSYYWGRLVMRFDETMCRAASEWEYCDTAPNTPDSFNARYLAPLHNPQ